MRSYLVAQWFKDPRIPRIQHGHSSNFVDCSVVLMPYLGNSTCCMYGQKNIFFKLFVVFTLFIFMTTQMFINFDQKHSNPSHSLVKLLYLFKYDRKISVPLQKKLSLTIKTKSCGNHTSWQQYAMPKSVEVFKKFKEEESTKDFHS